MSISCWIKATPPRSEVPSSRNAMSLHSPFWCPWSHSLVMGLYGATSPSLALDRFHGCGIERLLGGHPASVRGTLCFTARGLSLGMIYVVDRHQKAIVHYLEALQHLMEGKDFYQNLSFSNPIFLDVSLGGWPRNRPLFLLLLEEQIDLLGRLSFISPHPHFPLSKCTLGHCLVHRTLAVCAFLWSLHEKSIVSHGNKKTTFVLWRIHKEDLVKVYFVTEQVCCKTSYDQLQFNSIFTECLRSVGTVPAYGDIKILRRVSVLKDVTI